MQLEFAYLADHPDLVPTIIRWWDTVWSDQIGAIEQAEKILRDSLNPGELPIHILAYLDGELVGSAALKDQELAKLYPDYHYWLGSVFVHAPHRGHKIASALSDRIVELARERHLPHLYLQTQNLQGGLYAKLGWQPVEEFEYRGQRGLLMLRQLEYDQP